MIENKNINLPLSSAKSTHNAATKMTKKVMTNRKASTLFQFKGPKDGHFFFVILIQKKEKQKKKKKN